MPGNIAGQPTFVKGFLRAKLERAYLASLSRVQYTMGILPGRYNFKIFRGGTVDKRFTIYLDVEQNQPRDLTNSHVTFQIYNGTEIDWAATDADNIVLGGTEGTIDLTIPADVTEAFPWTRANYVLYVIDDDSSDPYLHGQIAIQTPYSPIGT
jgi:hypothetical protein